MTAHDRSDAVTKDPAALLAAHALRVTDQRIIVLGAMLAEPNDITVQGLHERLRPEHPKLGLATVYRTLNALAEADVLDRLNHGRDAICLPLLRPRPPSPPHVLGMSRGSGTARL